MLSALDSSDIRRSVERSILDFKIHPEPKPAYTDFILHRNPQNNESAETTAFWNTRLRLVNLLQSGLEFDASSILERIEPRRDLLLAEFVILYGRVSTLLIALSVVVSPCRGVEITCT
jgi:hypothetical protein